TPSVFLVPAHVTDNVWTSEAAQASPSLAVIGRVAVALFRDANAFEIESGIMFVSHADAAVHLDHFVGYAARRVAGQDLRERSEAGEIGVIGIDGSQTRLHSRASEHQLAEHFGCPMLERLK